MLSERTKSQLYYHAFALIAVALLDYFLGIQYYWVIASSAVVVFIAPLLVRWYANTSDTARLFACAAVVVSCATLVGVYLKLFMRLPSPPNPTYWLLVAIILFFPVAMLVMAVAAARRVLERKHTVRDRVA